MPVRPRDVLKSQFRNGSIPSELSFATLIDSMLNKTEDQFLGRWKPGVPYRQGDVVIHARKLWEMKAEGSLCASDAPAEGDVWQSIPETIPPESGGGPVEDPRVPALTQEVEILKTKVEELITRILALESPNT